MGLSSALQIGTSALNASQLAIQIAGNNLANAATPGYSRQIAMLAPTRADRFGRMTLGTGVQVSDVRRQVDIALQARLWNGISGESAASQDSAILSQLEDVVGTLGDHDLSSELSSFFNSWSERANGHGSSALVVQQGQRLADFIRRVRVDLTHQRDAIDGQLATRVDRADGLLAQIADVNRSISDAEAGGGQGSASTLRDQRDNLISELSQYMDVSTVEQSNGAVDVLVGSTPVVLGAHSRGLELLRQTVNGEVAANVSVKEDGQDLTIRSGEIGALLSNRGKTISDVVTRLDTLTSQLIYQVNRLHSTGATAAGLSTTTGTLGFGLADQTRALNDPANATMGALPFHPTSGGITVRVQGPGGATQTVRINVDLDGRDATGAPSFASDTTIEDIRAGLDHIPGLKATLTGDGKLKVDADSGYSFSFTEDTSGVLAAVGVNSYFTGTSATDIGMNADLTANPDRLCAGSYKNDEFVENGNALNINDLQDASLTALGGISLSRHWQETVQQVGVSTDAAKSNATAASTVRQSLDAQRASVSGVSVDEESVNLLTYQRQYQGAAKYISTVDSLMQTLIDLV